MLAEAETKRTTAMTMVTTFLNMMKRCLKDRTIAEDDLELVWTRKTIKELLGCRLVGDEKWRVGLG